MSEKKNGEKVGTKKRKKPKFKRQRGKYKKLGGRWRSPRGMHSKHRKEKREAPAKPKIGYRNPKEIRGLHPSGYEEKLIYNPKEIEKLNKEKHAVRIAGNVGKRKREKIIEKAESKDLKILNK